MYLSLIVVAALLAEHVTAFQGFPTSIFGSKPVVDVEAGLHLPKTVLGNKLMVGNTIFLDSNLLPIHDSFLKLGGGIGIPDLETKIFWLKKLINPIHHSILDQYEFCPITGRKLSKIDHFKKLFNLVDCDSDHFKKVWGTLPFGGAVDANKLLDVISNCGVSISGGIPTTLPVVCPDEEKKQLFHLLQLFAPSAIPDMVTGELTGILAGQKLGEWKKLIALIALTKPEVLQHFVKDSLLSSLSSEQCPSYIVGPAAPKELLDVKEFDHHFKISLCVGPSVTCPEEVQIFFDNEKKLHIKTATCSKIIPLPTHIDISNVKTLLHEGQLIISVPKIVGGEAVTASGSFLGALMHGSSEDKQFIKVNTI